MRISDPIIEVIFLNANNTHFTFNWHHFEKYYFKDHQFPGTQLSEVPACYRLCVDLPYALSSPQTQSLTEACQYCCNRRPAAPSFSFVHNCCVSLVPSLLASIFPLVTMVQFFLKNISLAQPQAIQARRPDILPTDLLPFCSKQKIPIPQPLP